MKIKNLLSVLLCFVTLPIFAQDFDFFDTKTVQEIRVTTQAANWRYVLDSLRVNGDGLLTADAMINGQSYKDIGIRYEASRGFTPGKKRNSIHLQLDYKTAQQQQAHSTIRLSSALRDPSMVRQIMTYEIAGSYMPTPRANYANLYVNNQYCGIFINIEPLDASFFEQHYSSTAGTLIKSTPSSSGKAEAGCKQNAFATLQYDKDAKCYDASFTLEQGENVNGLIQLTRILNEDNAKLEEVLDVDETLWMLAINNVLANLNSYTGNASRNYYLYQDAAGVFHPILGETNFSFGSYKNVGLGSDMTIKQLHRLDPLLYADDAAKPLISQLLKNDLYKRQYLSNIRTILREYFWNDTFNKRVKKLRARIRFLLESDEYKYYSLEEFNKSSTTVIGKNSKVPGIVSFMQVRSDFLKKHPIMTILPPRITEINVVGREALSSQKIDAFEIQATTDRFPRSVLLYYRFNEKETFQSANMQDDGAHSDIAAKDGIYGIKITPPTEDAQLEYYFFIENAKAVNYSPSRYMSERYTATLNALNE